jgi:hypothetical protein
MRVRASLPDREYVDEQDRGRGQSQSGDPRPAWVPVR